MFFKNVLIIAPHADDELFVLDFLYSRSFKFNKIYLLVLDNNYQRRLESQLFCSALGIKLIDYPNNAFFLEDGIFHTKFSELNSYLLEQIKKYSLILSPMIEGGHQDHDTVASSLLFLKDKFNFNKEIWFFPCYGNFKRFPFIYKCGLDNNKYKINQIKYDKSKNWLIRIIFLILSCYKSQYKSWALIFPALFISRNIFNSNKLISAQSLYFKNIAKYLPNKCLYSVYRGISKKKWLMSLNLDL